MVTKGFFKNTYISAHNRGLGNVGNAAEGRQIARLLLQEENCKEEKLIEVCHHYKERIVKLAAAQEINSTKSGM